MLEQIGKNLNKTQECILNVAQEEFSGKDFKDVSLREVVKKAGVTLGAFYGYYASKEALFHAIVGDAAEKLFQCFVDSQWQFKSLPAKEQTLQMIDYSSDGVNRIFDMIYQEPPIYKILFFHAAGTRYEGYIQNFIELEVQSTHQFISCLEQEHGIKLDIDTDLIHILCSSMFISFLEPIDHDMPKEKALHYVDQLKEFYTTGWSRLLGL